MAQKEYTPEELAAFRRKDKLFARQTSLNAAAAINEGKGSKPATVIKQADEYFEYLMKDQLSDEEANKEAKKAAKNYGTKRDAKKKSSAKESDVVPVPSSLNQKKVMDKIAEKVGAKTEQEVIALRKSVLAWVKEEFDGNQYPSKESSIEKYLSWRESNG
jgi:hypothetical protein